MTSFSLDYLCEDPFPNKITLWGPGTSHRRVNSGGAAEGSVHLGTGSGSGRGEDWREGGDELNSRLDC